MKIQDALKKTGKAQQIDPLNSKCFVEVKNDVLVW